MRFVTLIVLVWLIIGAFASYQRGDFESTPENCAGAGTIALTVAAGPLNYFGIHPEVADCNVTIPQPSE